MRCFMGVVLAIVSSVATADNCMPFSEYQRTNLAARTATVLNMTVLDMDKARLENWRVNRHEWPGIGSVSGVDFDKLLEQFTDSKFLDAADNHALSKGVSAHLVKKGRQETEELVQLMRTKRTRWVMDLKRSYSLIVREKGDGFLVEGDSSVFKLSKNVCLVKKFDKVVVYPQNPGEIPAGIKRESQAYDLVSKVLLDYKFSLLSSAWDERYRFLFLGNPSENNPGANGFVLYKTLDSPDEIRTIDLALIHYGPDVARSTTGR